MKAVRKVSVVAPGGHRHTAPGTHEHEFEPQHGLPELLPEDEKLLWQGSPDWRALAITRFHARKVAVYFVVLLVARVVALVSDGMALVPALLGSLTLFSAAALAVGALVFLAWFSARNTVYTLTDKRVVMRIGIVLTLTLNLPFKRIEAAALNAFGGDAPGAVGDIALTLLPPDRIAYLHLWPHARRWHLARPQPTLLCLRDAGAVAALLTEAWRLRTGIQPGVAPRAAVAADHAGAAPEMAPQLATR